MKHKQAIEVLCTIVLTLILCILQACQSAGEVEVRDVDALDTVLTVNTISVGYDEYRFFLKKELALTHSHYHITYNANTNNREFWSTSFDGMTPMDHIKQKANRRIRHVKAIQSYAHEAGLSSGFDFKSLLSSWCSQNSNRTKLQKEGKVVYGKVNLGLSEYYEQEFNRLERLVKEELEGTFRIEDSVLMGHYHKVKNKLFRYADSIDIMYWELSGSGLNDTTLSERVKTALDYLSVKPNVDINMLFPDGPKFIYGETLLDNPLTYQGEENTMRFLAERAMQLGPGELALVKSLRAFYIIGLKSPVRIKVKSYPEVKHLVRDSYLLARWAEHQKRLLENSKCTIRKEVYDTISYRSLF